MNTVVEYEVVLASGELVTASNTRNSDLYKALKGGGNNFGIVTSYKMKVFQTGAVRRRPFIVIASNSIRFGAGKLFLLGKTKRTVLSPLRETLRKITLMIEPQYFLPNSSIQQTHRHCGSTLSFSTGQILRMDSLLRFSLSDQL
jgi:hypothetical protein